jgi:hypothetical protein
VEQKAQEEPIYQTKYLGFWIKVYPHRVDFRSATGVQSVPINQIASVELGTLGILQVTLVSIIGEKFSIPTTKKKEVQQAVQDAQARSANQLQANVANLGRQISIDEYLAQLKSRKDTLQLQLDGINTQMSNIRAHYQQSRSNFIFKETAYGKNSQLKSLQPTKEKLQREILAVKTELTRIQTLKRQGVTKVNIQH